jgi:fatty-acyl-CoA synthase
MLMNVFSVLDRTAGGPRGDQPAIVFDGVARSYLELRDRSLKLANALQGIGVKPGERVAVLLRNGHAWPEMFFGIAALGAICVPVNVLLTAPEIDVVLDDCDASAMVVDEGAEELLAQIRTLPDRVITVGRVDAPEGLGALDYEDLLASAGTARLKPPGLDDLFIFFYTSGTTGRPKGAAHTHSGVMWNSFHQIADFGLTHADTYLAVPSMSWAAGFNNLILPLWWMGGRSVMLPTGGATIERIVATAVEGGATHTFLVPTLLKQLLSAPDQLELLRGSPLRWIISGAEPVPRPVIEAVGAELPGCSVLQGYGMSEFPTIATALRPEEAISHAGSAGRGSSITHVAVRLEDGSIAQSGEGEVLLRSLATMREYWRLPEASEEAFVDDWLNTGDYGSLDTDGFLTITGRKKDLIISGGLNIYPKEVEEVIYRLDDIAEVSVVGVADERWGETTVAIIVPSGPRASVEAVQEACRERLAGYKRPRKVLIRQEALPRTPSGKVLARELRPWAAAQLGLDAEQQRA